MIPGHSWFYISHPTSWLLAKQGVVNLSLALLQFDIPIEQWKKGPWLFRVIFRDEILPS